VVIPPCSREMHREAAEDRREKSMERPVACDRPLCFFSLLRGEPLQ
jgi:hypothetical protein